MSICDDPNAIPAIDLDECIGNSLVTLNTNFQRLREEICTNSTEISSLQVELSGITTRYNTLTSVNATLRPKAIVAFNGTTGTPLLSYNIGSVTRTNIGRYTVTFSPAFTNTNYAVIGTSQETLSTSNQGWVQPTSFTNSNVGINIRKDNGDYLDPAYISIIVYNT